MWSSCPRGDDIRRLIDHDTMEKLPKTFNALLKSMSSMKSDQLDSVTVSAIIHRIASVYGALLLAKGTKLVCRRKC